MLDSTAADSNGNSDEHESRFDNIQPCLNNDKAIIVHSIEFVELNIEFIGFEDEVVFSSLKSLRPHDDIEGIKVDDDGADNKPENDTLGYKHVDI